MNSDIVTHLFLDIPFHLDVPALLKRVHLKEDSRNAAEFLQLAGEAAGLAKPKAFYLLAYILDRGEDFTEIEGLSFTSRVLSINLKGSYRVFPYLATCGMELQSWAEGFDDTLYKFWAEALKEAALMTAIRAINQDMDERHHLENTSSMSPGSLEDWPIEQQRILFDLFGSRETRLGVQLTDSFLMIPTKTVSGIRFTTAQRFESCQLCPRENCPGRRIQYEPALSHDRYGLK